MPTIVIFGLGSSRILLALHTYIHEGDPEMHCEWLQNYQEIIETHTEL